MGRKTVAMARAMEGERLEDRDGRGIHSPRVMRSSPPGGMNEFWKELAIGGAKEERRGDGERWII